MAPKQIRPIRVECNIAYVTLTKGYEAVIDASDVPLIGKWDWSAIISRRPDGSLRAVYARRGVRLNGGNNAVYMHRVIGGPMGLDETDHKDGDGLNNRRSNLRNVTRTQNSYNGRTRVDNTSGFKGVGWDESNQRWRARIKTGGKEHTLGYFICRAAAAVAYARASSELHGEYGRTG